MYRWKKKPPASRPTAQHPVTIVSALLNLHREKWPYFRRPFETYLDYAENLLLLNVPLVLYVDQGAESFVSKLRAGKENLTRIKVINVTDLDFHKQYYAQVEEIMSSEEFKQNHALLTHPEGFSPDYNILMNSKLSLLYNATVDNVFSSRYFFWVDMGYGHGDGNVYPKSGNWIPQNIMNYDDRISYIELNPVKYVRTIFDIYKRKVPPFLNGGFFGGSAWSVQEYYWLHREMWDLFLMHGMVDDDQTLAVLCYFKKPSLFNLFEGWWYDAFNMFQ